MEWCDDLPDVSQWKPDSDHKETLKNGLLLTCRAAQQRIIEETRIERQFNIHNFDSGTGVEDIVRQELTKLLPRRYVPDKGVINDHDGKTAGDCDVVIRDILWSPVVKLGTTPDSRRYHFPIESVYAVSEIKQTLGFKQLDKAMEKLVTISRLTRPENPYGHITENQHVPWLDQGNHILNPLHTTVIGVNLASNVQFQDIVQRFHAINARLSRNEVVTVLCILQHGVAWFSVRDRRVSNATFMWDRDELLHLNIYENEPNDVFYKYYIHLMGHLHRSVLGSQGIAQSYGEDFGQHGSLYCDEAVYNCTVDEKEM